MCSVHNVLNQWSGGVHILGNSEVLYLDGHIRVFA